MHTRTRTPDQSHDPLPTRHVSPVIEPRKVRTGGQPTPEPSDTSRWAGRWKLGCWASSATSPLSPEPPAAADDDDSATMSPCPAESCWPTLVSSMAPTARRKHPVGCVGGGGRGSGRAVAEFLRWSDGAGEMHSCCTRVGSPRYVHCVYVYVCMYRRTHSSRYESEE